MSSLMSPSVVSSLTYAVLVPTAFTAILLTSTYIFTTLRYHASLWQNSNKKGTPISPVKIPYTIPFIGSAIAFLDLKPGGFWRYLFAWHPRSTGACTLKMGGKHMHILYDPHAIQAIMKARDLNREGLLLDVMSKGFGLEVDEVLKYYGFQESGRDEFGGRTPLAQQEHVNADHLIRSDRVVELLTKFTGDLRRQFSSEFHSEDQPRELDLYAWIRTEMFKASTNTFFGDMLLQDYPDLERDFYDLDANFLTCYFGIPRWISPKAYDLRDRVTQGMVRWHERTLERTKGTILDPDGAVAWDRIQGSRACRARHVYYGARDITLRGKAVFDLGFLFGISSNAVPATGWMLLHILDSKADKTLLPRVMDEINACLRPDGTLDIPMLSSQPLLLSIWHETLRMYVDTLVVREPTKDMVVPIGSGDGKLLLTANSIITLPTWIEHRDDALWSDASKFCPERFLTVDPATGKSIFSVTGSAGKFFPFGGGKTICPGRLFAKQEVLVTVALILTQFDVEVLGYKDGQGKRTEKFPVPKDAYPGTAMVVLGGDARVRISRK